MEQVNTDAWNGHSISADQKVEAWKAGQKAAAESFTKGQKTAFVNYGKDGKVIYSPEAIQLKKSDRNTYRQLEKLAKEWGVNIEIGTFSEWENGSIHDGVIRVNAERFQGEEKQQTMVRILGHEITHRMQETAPKGYVKYRDLALEEVAQRASGNLEDVITQYQQRYSEHTQLTREEAMDEIVADYTQFFIEDTQLFRDFITKSEQHRSAGKCLMDAVKAVVAKIRQTFSSRKSRDAASQEVLDKPLAEVEQALKLWEQAYAEGQEVIKNTPVRTDTGDGKIRHSVSASENEFLYNIGDFSYQVDNISKIPAGEAMVVCGTPQVFVDIGLNRLPMTLNLEHAKDAITLNPNHKDRYIGKTALKDLPRALEEPVAIIASASHSATSLVAIVDLKGQNGKSVIVPVYLNGMSKAHGIRMDVNAISSAHERKNAISGLLMGAIKEEMNGNIRVFYMDNKKANQLIRGEGLQLPNSFMSMNGSNHSIFEDGSPAKGHFKEIAQTSTKQFKRWFGKSKVVNENGAPLVVYHGTDAEFTSFDMSKGRANMDIQGAFFSPYQDDARGYGRNVGAFYLSIQNPADESTAYKALSRFKGQNNAGVKARDYLIKQGYDGVYNGYDEYIAFYPNQIKSATQNIGTFDKQNPDTRYSLAGSENILQDNLERTQALKDTKERLRYLGKQVAVTKQTTADPKAVDALADRIVQSWGAEMDGEEIAGKLQVALDHALRIRTDADVDSTFQEMVQIGRTIAENITQVEGDIFTQYGDLRKHLRDMRIYVGPEVVGDISDYYDTVRPYRNRLKLTTNESARHGAGVLGIDEAFQALSGEFPELFNEEKTSAPADQLRRLMEVTDALYQHGADHVGLLPCQASAGPGAFAGRRYSGGGFQAGQQGSLPDRTV